MRRITLSAIGLLPLLLAGVIAASCSGSSKSAEPTETPMRLPILPVYTPTPSPTPVNPQAILQESGSVMNLVDSFSFELIHRSGGTPFFAGIVMQEARGDVARPDRLSVTLSGAMGQLFIEVQLITVGDTTYMTNPLTGQWDVLPANVSPLAFFNPREGIAAIMSQMSEITFVGVRKNGDSFYLVRGKVPSEALQPIAGAVARGKVVEAELKIRVEGLHLLEATLTGRVTPTEEEGIVRVIKLSHFNEPVDIVSPL